MVKSEKPRELEPAAGVIALDKPAGMTSHDVVARARRLFMTKQIGHTGTLDPMATGVLVLLVGRAVKAAEYVTASKKRYAATLRLGVMTDTGDITGKVIGKSESEIFPSSEEVRAAANKFFGEYMQTPPMYSALKSGGRKLVDLARQGIEVERQARCVEIFSISCERSNENANDYVLDVTCSAGTYIRVLCEDIGNALGCGGTMASLRRLSVGSFDIGGCRTLEELENMSADSRAESLRPVESAFGELPKVQLDENFFRLIKNGVRIAQHRLHLRFENGQKLRLFDPRGNFFALGEITPDENELSIRTLKIFVL